jgi:hypothetical protein
MSFISTVQQLIIPAGGFYMAKFGHFKSGIDKPLVEYEGDLMKRDKEFVEVRMFGDVHNPSGTLVAVVRLDKGHDVRKISD